MWIIKEIKLKVFWKLHPHAKQPLIAWIKELEHARYANTAQVRARHGSADFVGDKVVFDIGGNKFRLIVRFVYANMAAKPPVNGIVFVLFVGAHKEYDNINVADL